MTRSSPDAARLRRRAAGVALAALAAAAVLGRPLPSLADGSSTSTASDSSKATWTMMVYAVADTESIGPLMEQDLADLAALPDDPTVNVVVLVDMPETNETGLPTVSLPGVGTFTDAKLLKLENHRYEQVRDEGEIDMGRPDTLSTFIEETADKFPADHYGLTLMDHGGGRLGGYWDTGPPSPRALSIPEIREGMLDGMQAAGISRFDLLFHSACLMSNYETASALAPLARVMAGSEEEMLVFAMLPLAGFTALSQGGGADVPEAAGAAFLDGYVQTLEDYSAQYSDVKTTRDLAALSTIDGDKMATLDAAMDSFTKVAVEHMPEIVTQVARARAQALTFVTSLPGSQGEQADLIDLGDFLRHLTDVPDDVAVARDAVFTALTNVVLHQDLGQATQQATGLNIYLPANADNLGDYLTDGSAPPGWGSFVAAFLQASGQTGQGNGSGSAVAFASQDAQVLSADSSGIKIQGQLTEGSEAHVVEADTYVYAKMGDQDSALAMVLPGYLDAGAAGAVQGTWDYSLTTLSDGQKTIPVTTAYQAQSGGLVGSFLAQYTPPATSGVTPTPIDVGVRLLLSSQGQIESVSIFAQGDNGTSSGINLEAGGTLTPYVFVSNSSSGLQKQLSSQSIGVSAQLQVAFTKLAPGTPFEMGVVVFDAGGHGAGAFTAQTVPQ